MQRLFEEIPNAAFWFILNSYAIAGEQPVLTMRERQIALFNYGRFAIDRN